MNGPRYGQGKITILLYFAHLVFHCCAGDLVLLELGNAVWVSGLH